MRFRSLNAGLVLTMTAAGVSIAAAPGARKPDPAPPVEKSGPRYPFSFDMLLADAKRLAAKPYTPQRSTLSADLDKMSPEQYQPSFSTGMPRSGARMVAVPPRAVAGRLINAQRRSRCPRSRPDWRKDLIATPAMFAIGPVAQLPGARCRCRCPDSGSSAYQLEKGLGRIPRIPGRELFSRRGEESPLRPVRPGPGHRYGRGRGRGVPGVHAFLDRAARPRVRNPS